jgi:uncharacterized DUF497 family protein
MDFEGFDWDDGNREKCRKHGMSLRGVESVFTRARIWLDVDHSGDEARYRAIGLTRRKKWGFVVFTFRPQPDGRILIRPISARYMHKKEIARYEQTHSDF